METNIMTFLECFDRYNKYNSGNSSKTIASWIISIPILKLAKSMAKALFGYIHLF